MGIEENKDSTQDKIIGRGFPVILNLFAMSKYQHCWNSSLKCVDILVLYPSSLEAYQPRGKGTQILTMPLQIPLNANSLSKNGTGGKVEKEGKKKGSL